MIVTCNGNKRSTGNIYVTPAINVITNRRYWDNKVENVQFHFTFLIWHGWITFIIEHD